jgi:hypothetical protein
MQDDIDTSEFPYKVNAVCLFRPNTGLKDLCIDSKGKQVLINYDDSVIAYSSDGEEKIA